MPAAATPAAKVNRFDGDRAWAELAARRSRSGRGPPARRRSRTLAERLRAALPERPLRAASPGGLRNVVGALPGASARRSSLAAHYDTKDMPPGSSAPTTAPAGPRWSLEPPARCAAAAARPRAEVRFVLFDGEEAPARRAARLPRRCGLRGSRAYAARARQELKALDPRSTSSPTATCALPRERQLGRRALGAAARRRRAASACGRVVPRPAAGDRRGRPHAVHARRRPGDRPDRLRLPLLAQRCDDLPTCCPSAASTPPARRCVELMRELRRH